MQSDYNMKARQDDNVKLSNSGDCLHPDPGNFNNSIICIEHLLYATYCASYMTTQYDPHNSNSDMCAMLIYPHFKKRN